MRIGLYNLELQIVNSAMMRASSHYKRRGDKVEQYSPIFHKTYDRIYAFSIFNFTPKHYVREDMTTGGTGFNITGKLPPKIEREDYDWSLYPDCDFSIVWFSTGCTRKCPFCVVPEKEGMIKPVKPKNLNPNGKYVKVQDNNFFANPKWREAIRQLREWGQPVDFAGGIDARILTKEMCDILNTFKTGRHTKEYEKQIKIAWDNPREDLVPKLKQIIKWGIPPWKLMCYVLIGYWSTKEEDMARVMKLKELKIDPYVMPFDKHDPYQMAFSRWVNRKAIFNSIPWEIYHQNPDKT